MKLLHLLLFTSSSLFSQFSITIPLNTIHFESSEFFTDNQGGSKIQQEIQYTSIEIERLQYKRKHLKRMLLVNAM